jgi:protein involved in polysaccharide export with SLBB domain
MDCVMFRKLVRFAIAYAAGLQLGGCYTDFGRVVPAENPLVQIVVATRVQPGDRIKVAVYGEENLNGAYDVDPAGFVSLPLAGNIRVAGHTKQEIQSEITAKYSGYLQKPKVTVDFVALRPFYVMGEVMHPGEFPYRAGLDVVSAITTAGGLTYRASGSTVLVRHVGNEVWREYAIVPSVMIAPGDYIRIPARYF